MKHDDWLFAFSLVWLTFLVIALPIVFFMY